MRSGLVSAASAALVATVAGVGGTLPVVLAAAQAVGATPEQASSWVSGLGLATAVSALILSVRYRMPIITAWSTPGAALIASSSAVPSFRAAIGALRAGGCIDPADRCGPAACTADRENSRQHRRRNAGRDPAAAGRGDDRAGAEPTPCWCCR